MQARANLRTRVRIINEESWLLNKRYSEMFTGFTRFPQKNYRFERGSLTPRDRFIVEFCEQAERCKKFFTPEHMIKRMIEFNVSDRMLDRLAYEIWRDPGGAETDRAMVEHVRQAAESCITEEMERWADREITPQAAEGLYYNIPSNRSRFGSATDREPYPIRNPVREREKKFFEMEAPPVLVQDARESRDDTTMRLVRSLERDVKRVNSGTTTGNLVANWWSCKNGTW